MHTDIRSIEPLAGPWPCRGRVLIPIVLLALLAAPDAQAGITDVEATYPLAAGNAEAWGLAYDELASPDRLYVSDISADRIFVYAVDATGLTSLAGEGLDTTSLHPDFIAPRGLAHGRYGGAEYLYALTSEDPDGDGVFSSRLWRVDLGTLVTDFIDLDRDAFGLQGREVSGLAYHGGRAFIAYDTSNLPSLAEQVQRGILKLRVYETGAPNDWWSRASGGDRLAVEKHMPHSGRGSNSSGWRAQSFGLAATRMDDAWYLFGTSQWKYLYAGELFTGRGLFHWGSPGNGQIYGLAVGDAALWAVDRRSGVDQVHRIQVGGDWGVPTIGPRRFRHLNQRLVSIAQTDLDAAGVTHNFAMVPAHSYRPNQGRDGTSFSVTTTGDAQVQTRTYDPAGDTGARQFYTSISYDEPVSAGEEIVSELDVDIWCGAYRHYVYPHRVTASVGWPPAAYTDDDPTVYQMTDTDAYDTFVDAVHDWIRAEYGASAASSSNPYWRARNILEFIRENYQYAGERDLAAGHYWYNPANFKLELPFDATAGNEDMSCSPSAFALAGVLRYLGIPARWVGTTKRRQNNADGVNWDTNEDDYFGYREHSVDLSFHRWVEVWLGKPYGWQRFDPTPSSNGPRQFSQFEMMERVAQGLEWSKKRKDLVLTLGSGYHEPFYHNVPGDEHNQRYNAVARYEDDEAWHEPDGDTDLVDENHVYRRITWTNSCFLQVITPLGGGALTHATPTVEWTTTGRWDMDPGAMVSISLQRVLPSGGDYIESGAPILLMSDVPATVSSRTVSLAGATPGLLYRFEIAKQGDSVTGDAGPVFTYLP
jgi:hypothetical protein